jgi:hypothetical protein
MLLRNFPSSFSFQRGKGARYMAIDLDRLPAITQSDGRFGTVDAVYFNARSGAYGYIGHKVRTCF